MLHEIVQQLKPNKNQMVSTREKKTKGTKTSPWIPKVALRPSGVFLFVFFLCDGVLTRETALATFSFCSSFSCLFDFPDGLIPLGPFAAVSFSVTCWVPSRFIGRRTGTVCCQNRAWHNLQKMFGPCLYPGLGLKGFPLGFPLRTAAPWRDLSWLRAFKLIVPYCSAPQKRSTFSNLASKPCTLSFFNWILKKSLKSRRASPFPLILK